MDGSGVDWLRVSLGFVAGLALFLFGVDLLAKALREAGGGRFQQLLQRSARNRLSALTAGTLATVALDSSSVTIILMIAIIDAGLIGLAGGLPMILGANIGTTISSQIFAWNVDAFAPVLLALGLLWRALGKSDRAKLGGTILFATGLILYGLSTIGEAAEPLKDDPRVVGWLERLEQPLLGVLAGAAVTVAIQSSSAMLGIVITLATGGLISLPAGLAMMLGAEIGTCADTLVATLGRSRAAVKAGLFHLLFNIVSVTLGLFALGLITRFAFWSADGTAQQIANAHVMFNLAGAMLMLPFVGPAARLLDRLVPDRMTEPQSVEVPAAAG